MSNRQKLIFLGLLLLGFQAGAQDCKLSLSGNITDIGNGSSIAYANIYLREAEKGTVSNDSGFFQIENLCKGFYHLSISHIGCSPVDLFFELSSDTLISVSLDHSIHGLEEIAILDSRGSSSTQESRSIQKTSIDGKADQNLTGLLESISGVNSISNGSGIAKPMVQGLYGNRLTIMNNGIPQSGQQWGVDHSPEIDPLVANSIRVVKGVSALEVQGSTLGSVIYVEPGAIQKEPHLHGSARYFFETNGLGNGLNFQLQEHGDRLAWRAIGTLKKRGDTHTPDYYLNNTGAEEANFALQLEKNFGENFQSELYLSTYNANLGILRGSQVGNLTDLEEAIGRSEPFFTEPDFSYEIDAPFQRINHHLGKFHTRYSRNPDEWIDFTYSFQFNQRKEFDVRRGGRSDIPSLSLDQTSQFAELKYRNELADNWVLKTGFQLNRIDNTNDPETGILPLIPDYISNEYGVFGIVTKELNRLFLEFGARYDFEDRRVAAISFTTPREVVRYNNQYQNLSASGGLRFDLSERWKLSLNSGYALRNPEVNELYSNGLHQGVSGIEEGDPNLNPEASLKSTLSLQGRVGKKLLFEGLFYYQTISDFIYLNPQDEIRLTIRGAFPVFRYEQTDARIAGFDFVANYQATDYLNASLKYSFLDGKDQSNDIPLVFMPANSLFGEINYVIASTGKVQNIELSLNNRFVFEQKNLLDSQDFLPPPAAYNLIGARVSADSQTLGMRFNWSLRVDNMLNTRYRDYLNRQRYFADELGINLIFGIQAKF